jgi:outer membrane protein assembly factor BamB
MMQPRFPARIADFPGRRAALPAGVALALALAAAGARADDWPQWLGPSRDGVWRETGLLDKFPKDGPRVRWRTPIGQGYAGPAVANGRVYVMDRVLPTGITNPTNGFDSKTVTGKERVLCLDEATGKPLWTHEYDCTYRIGYPSGPRATPTVADGKVYTLGAMGDLCCLDAETGKPLWSKNFLTDFPGRKDHQDKVGIWGCAAHPLVDGNRLICLVGGPDHLVVAFDKDTGKELWHALSARQVGYAPPMIYEAGGSRQLIVWDPEAVHGLDPEGGQVFWSVPFELRAPPCMSISTPRVGGDRLFVTSFYDGSLMLKLDADKPGAEVLWKAKGRSEKPEDTKALQSIISTPVLKDGYVYGVCSYGELRCLKADTGERLWVTRQATTRDGEAVRWANAFLVPQGDRFFLFNELGDLIIARLTPSGYEEVSRAHILEPTNPMPGRLVVWSHPAFANKSAYARNDKEIVCVSLEAEK